MITSISSFVFAESPDSTLQATPISIPGVTGGIGFDDLIFVHGLGKVLVPGGHTGKLYLIDPKTAQVSAINGFSVEDEYKGGHSHGITSADEGRGFIFTTDRNTQKVNVVDPKTEIIVASEHLANGPDYVRYLEATNEVWVTQPGSEQIEVFNFETTDKPKFTYAKS